MCDTGALIMLREPLCRVLKTRCGEERLGRRERMWSVVVCGVVVF